MSAERLREAARVLREDPVWMVSPPDPHGSHDGCRDCNMDRLVLAVADWLDGEAWGLDALEPLAELINATFTAASGNEAALIEFGRDESGNYQYRSNTVPAALAVADAILGGDS